MKANFVLIGLCILLLPTIYFINNQQNHWTQLLPLGYLEYKTELIKVDAKYSSQECSSCEHISKENRPNQETFKCVKCNHSGNADFEASLTILKRGQTLLRT